MIKNILLVVGMIMMGILSGCATTSRMTDAQNGQNAREIPILDINKGVYVNVTTSNQDYAKERNILSDNLSAKMKEAGYIVYSSANDDLQKVEVNFVYLKRVDPRARFFFGVLAGFAEVNVIVNVSTPEKNGQFRLDTSALDWTGFRGTTDQTLEAVAERIVQTVQGRKIESTQ